MCVRASRGGLPGWSEKLFVHPEPACRRLRTVVTLGIVGRVRSTLAAANVDPRVAWEASALTLRFRPMVWPGVPVPIPGVLKVSEVGRDGQWLLPNLWDPDNVFDLAGGLVEVPPEVYLRQFRDTPIDDFDALAQLCKLGMIRPLGPRPYQDLPPADDAQWHAMIARFSVEAGFDWRGDEAEREQISKRHRAEMVSPVHAAEVALRVRLMQRATDHLLAYLDGESLTRAWRHCSDEVEAWRNFTDVIVRRCTISISVSRSWPSTGPTTVWGSGPPGWTRACTAPGCCS
jgi:hypothetical protein